MKTFEQEVARFLREKYHISWKKAMAAFGHSKLREFEQAGNLVGRTAHCIACVVKGKQVPHKGY